MMNNKNLIFDLDDTLYSEHDYVRSGFWSVAETIKSTYPYIESVQLFNDLVRVWKTYGRGRVFNVVCENYRLDIEINTLIETYRNHKPTIQLYADAKEILHLLKKRNYKAGIITDGNSNMQWNKIRALGLDHLVDVITVSDDLGGENFWKPSTTPYKRTIQALNTSADKCIYVGDNPRKDFISARKLGMKTIRIIRPNGDHMKVKLAREYEADKTIFSLKELL
ncbi:HAD family hydrolase [Gracilibacillus lacisalsi]|uniref:HAD family hydrolase n=1 Tax=Gracilibacillus lacisalsi TaxID=393087 RepID=UPI000370B79C|nr:HAD family hydrolase [Gracilibacillus lacisalsi]